MYVYNCIITLRESSHHEERHEYQESIKDYWDYYSTMTTSFNKGKAEGKDEAKRESALRMKEKGYTVEDIAEITGLSEEEIKNL